MNSNYSYFDRLNPKPRRGLRKTRRTDAKPVVPLRSREFSVQGDQISALSPLGPSAEF